MNYEEEVRKFLATEENLPLALEIANQVNKMRAHYHRQFWKRFCQMCHQRLDSTAYNHYWELNDSVLSNLWGAWAGACFQPRKRSDQYRYLRIHIQQSTKTQNYSLQYGLSWSFEVTAKKPLPALESITNLEKKLLPPFGSHRWWLAIQASEINLRGESTMLEMALNQDIFIENMVDKLWHLMTTYQQEIRTINDELAQIG